MKWLVGLLFAFFLFLLCLAAASSQDILSVKQRALLEISTLEIQLMHSETARQKIVKQLNDLQTLQKNSNDALKKEYQILVTDLETRETIIEEQETRLKDLKKYVGKLETENSLLVAGLIVTGIVAAATTVWGLTR